MKCTKCCDTGTIHAPGGGMSPCPHCNNDTKNKPITVLIKFGHGLGDAVQMTVVLKHLAKYRPHWVIDFWCYRGKHSAIPPSLINKSWWIKDSPQCDYPQPDAADYDKFIETGFFENYSRYPDRPNTKITNMLQENFGLEYEPLLGRYEVPRGPLPMAKAENYLQNIGCQKINNRFNAVVVHNFGNTSRHRKDLPDWIMAELCELVLDAGRVPILLDWDRRSSLLADKRIFNPGVGPNDLWGSFGSGDAETIACLIQKSECFIGIDSGPGKIASSTDTPSLICWTSHHPLQFHDPSPNTTHLIPSGHQAMCPLDGDTERIKYFYDNYNCRVYEKSLHDLRSEASKWLGEKLSHELKKQLLRYVVPTGIGDSVWALTKIQDINEKTNEGRPINLIVSGNPTNIIDHRALSFLKRFKFLNGVTLQDISVIRDHSNPSDEKGRYRYEPDGIQGNFHFLCPNAALEKGIALKDWLPDYKLDWSIFDHFDWSGTEQGTSNGKAMGNFVAFYLGPKTGNTTEGHNRNGLWRPKDWIDLGRVLISRGMEIAVVGAPYDRSYWEENVKPLMEKSGQKWHDYIGVYDDVGVTFAFLKEAKFMVSYQAGLAMVLHYLGCKSVIWWRPECDSIHPGRYITFSEEMRYAWNNPALRNNYIGLVYGRENVGDIVGILEKRGWIQ